VDAIAIGFFALFLVPATIVGLLALATRDRWGVDRVAVASAGGAYRGGATAQVARTMPPRVALAAMLALGWAAVTGLVFVPAGGALVLVSLDGGRGALAAPTLAIVLSGLVHAVALGFAGVGLAVRSATAADVARRTAAYARFHHAAVFVVFSLAVLALEPSAVAVLAGLAVPCGLGWMVARALDAAARHLAALPEDEAPFSDPGPVVSGA